MKRTQQREQAFFLIFETMFTADQENDALTIYEENREPVGDYAKALFEGVCANTETLDDVIASYLNGWKINRIAKINLAILRLAAYEILYVDDTPDSVAINEAVELAKKYASAEDAAFINGVLGSVVRGKA